MKRITFLIIFLLINCLSLFAQDNHKNILKLDPVNYYRKVYPPSLYLHRVQLQKPITGNLTASFTPNVPQNVKNAINMAVEIWNYLLQFNTSVVAKFDWQVLPPGVLGGSATVSPIFYNGIYYPVSLANVLIGSDQNGSNPEMDITFGSTFNWYLGLDGNPPTNTVDLVTVAFHEIGHGLGWDGTFNAYENLSSGIILGNWGIPLGSEVYPMIFDTFIDNFVFDLLDTEEFPRNSPELGQELTSDHIFFNGNETQASVLWNVGSTYNIQWTDTHLGNVRIDLVRSGCNTCYKSQWWEFY